MVIYIFFREGIETNFLNLNDTHNQYAIHRALLTLPLCYMQNLNKNPDFPA